jgi:hypothetical protein
MSYPNNVLSAWQLTLMIAVPLMLLFGWLIAVFIAAREPSVPGIAAGKAVAPGMAATAPAETTAPAPRLTDVTVPVSPTQPDASPARLAA